MKIRVVKRALTLLAAATLGVVAMNGLAFADRAQPVQRPAAIAAEPAAHPPAGRPVPRIVQRWADAWNTGDGAAMGALFTAGGTYTDHAFQATFTGPAGIEQWVTITLDSFSAAHLTVDHAFRAGDDISVTWTFTGTFNGSGPFTPPYNPVGRTFSVPVTSVFTLHHDRIASVDDYYNLADLMRQVGLPAGPYTPATAN